MRFIGRTFLLCAVAVLIYPLEQNSRDTAIALFAGGVFLYYCFRFDYKREPFADFLFHLLGWSSIGLATVHILVWTLFVSLVFLWRLA